MIDARLSSFNLFDVRVVLRSGNLKYLFCFCGFRGNFMLRILNGHPQNTNLVLYHFTLYTLRGYNMQDFKLLISDFILRNPDKNFIFILYRAVCSISFLFSILFCFSLRSEINEDSWMCNSVTSTIDFFLYSIVLYSYCQKSYLL